jgi:hypothetical protein
MIAFCGLETQVGVSISQQTWPAAAIHHNSELAVIKYFSIFRTGLQETQE